MKIEWVIAFIAGATLGGFAGYKIAEKKSEKIYQEKLNKINDMLEKEVEEITNSKPNSKKSREGKSEKPIPEKPPLNTWSGDKAELKEYNDYISKYKTAEENFTPPRKKKETKKPVQNSVEIISEDEYREEEDYDWYEYTYYANDILTDDADEIIDNREEILGHINYLDEFEKDDSIYLVDHDKKKYYEIVWDEDDYPDERPHRI